MSLMFTGIIKHVGTVAGLLPAAAGRRLRLDVGPLAAGLSPGSSLAVDGVCLTAAAVEGGQADFDVVPETLSRSTLGELRAGAKVNLEPAIPVGSPLDGHIVQGHADGVAEVARLENAAGRHVLTLRIAPELTEQMVVKGSIALAGVSLTLTVVERGRFSVALIPTTLAQTTLGRARPADRLNVELDIIGKYVRRHLQAVSGGSERLAADGPTLEKLRRAGFA